MQDETVSSSDSDFRIRKSTPTSMVRGKDANAVRLQILMDVLAMMANGENGARSSMVSLVLS